MNTKEIFKNLEGYWTFKREILDRITNATSFAVGQASFIKVNHIENNCLEYEETGKLSLSKNSKEIKFNRKYIYELYDKTIRIILNDGLTKGKVFQTLTPSKNNNLFIGEEHVCRTDRHGGEYEFINSNNFKITHTVKGINNNLQIKSSLTKED